MKFGRIPIEARTEIRFAWWPRHVDTCGGSVWVWFEHYIVEIDVYDLIVRRREL